MTTTKNFKVSGMHCASCAQVIKRKLEKVPGVVSCNVNYASEKAQIQYDEGKLQISHLNHEIDKLGYKIIDEAPIHDHKDTELSELLKMVQVAMPITGIAIVIMIWEAVGMSPLQKEFFHHLLPLLATYMMFTVGVPYIKSVIRFIRYKVANMESLVGIGTLTAFIYSFIASVLDRPESYYEVTIVVIGFITLGKYLETKSKAATGEAIKKLLGLQAKMATVIRNGQEIEVPIDDVVIDDIAVVKPGQKIPLDGVIVEGKSAIDESMITGESMPVDKIVGDFVIGATINRQGYLKVRITKIGGDTMLSQIVKMVEEAQGSKAPIERIADRVSAVFVPIVIVFALLTLIVWIFLGNVPMGILSFVGILVIACPCAMGLATPTAIIVGVGKAAGKGILIKNAESLEKLSSVDFVVMDKTGTITKGEPQVTDIKNVSKFVLKDILAFATSLEAYSEHPLGEAIRNYATSRSVKTQSIKDFKILEGMGVEGSINSKKYFIGNIALSSELKIEVDQKIIDEFAAKGKTPVILMDEKKVLAYFAIADTLKDGVPQMVEKLHKQKIKVMLLTGDNKKVGEHIAGLAGIDKVVAEVKPKDKLTEIRKLQDEGHIVAMVGDGINDAPALSAANIGIAMGSGTDVAIESAGVTIVGGNIVKIPDLLVLGRSTMRIIRQNLFWAFIYNIIGIPVAAIGYLNPMIAGAAMAASSVSVVGNSLRLKAIK